MIHFCFFEYIKKVAARSRCEPVPTPRTGDYDDDYYDDSRVGKRHVERHGFHEIHYDDGRIDTVTPYVDLNSLKNSSQF